MMATNLVNAEFWQPCSICQEDLDGTEEHGGMVAISKRCFHVFHDKCIKPWVEDKKDNCPNCKLDYLTEWEILPNPEYSQEYNKWKATPDKYSFEQAFQERYGDITGFKGASPQEVVKPKALLGKHPERELSPEASMELFHHINGKVQALSENASKEEISKASHEATKIHGKVISDIKEESKDQWNRLGNIEEGNKVMRKMLDISQANTAHANFISAYGNKTDNLREKIDKKDKEITKKPKVDWALSKAYGEISSAILGYSMAITQARNISDHEEGKKRVLEIDAELEAFIASQPPEIQAILRPPIIEKPEEPQPLAWRLTATTIGGIAFGVFSIGGIALCVDLKKSLALLKENVFFCPLSWCSWCSQDWRI